MQHQPTHDVLRRAIRARICPTCYQRPEGTDFDPPHVARDCEPLCPIFLNVRRLVEVAAVCGSAPASFEQSVKDLVCARCTLAPSSGEYCSEYVARTCPLSRYARDVLELIDALQAPRTTAAPAAAANVGGPSGAKGL
jgi:hypothetical protein